MSEREPEPSDVETPEEDAREQRLAVGDDEVDEEIDLDAEADPADRAEQARSVPTGDDDYR